MKKVIGVAVLMIVMVLAGKNATAQNLKFGHINSDELIQTMPEYDSATAKLENFRKELMNALELMSVEFNNKNEAYQKDLKNLSDIVRQTKEQELVDMQKRIQDFQNNAQGQMQQKNSEVMQPIYAKVDKAIKDVGKENSFLYVFDIARGGLLYYDEAKSTNILSLVKTKLGMK